MNVLAKQLKARKMTIVGTIRKNRKEIPPILLDMKKKPNFYSEFVFERSMCLSMVSYVPKKKSSLFSVHCIPKKKFVGLMFWMNVSAHIDASARWIVSQWLFLQIWSTFPHSILLSYILSWIRHGNNTVHWIAKVFAKVYQCKCSCKATKRCRRCSKPAIWPRRNWMVAKNK